MKQAIVNIASNYQSLGDANSAITWYERYLQENPGAPNAGEIRNRINGLRQQARSQPMSGATADLGNDYFMSVTPGGKCFRWSQQKMPIRVFIAQGTPAIGFRESFGQDLSDALNEWSQATESRVTFMLVSDLTQADIYCDWTADPNHIVQSGTAVEGGLTRLTAQQRDSGPDVQISRARMTILTTGGGGSPRTDNEMKKVCLHEVGHAMGLNGHSGSNQDIMFYTEINSDWPVLSARDKATINRLYANYLSATNGR
jgi:predicted Zn-dependent protease